MAAAKESARQQRAKARKDRRREPEPATTEEIPEDAEGTLGDDPGEALRNAAGAALVGAALGAARVLARRRGEAGDEEEHEPEAGREADPEAEPESEVQSRPEPEPEPEPEQEERQAATPGDALAAVRLAKDELRELHGAEADSVSTVSRTEEGWRIGLEVVEVHRVPESTDVLATYEVELTDDGKLLSFERKRRYYRAEADKQ